MACVIKQTHIEGNPIMPQKTWCGADYWKDKFAFLDAQHFLIATEKGSSWGYPYCKKCMSAMFEILEFELDQN